MHHSAQQSFALSPAKKEWVPFIHVCGTINICYMWPKERSDTRGEPQHGQSLWGTSRGVGPPGLCAALLAACLALKYCLHCSLGAKKW